MKNPLKDYQFHRTAAFHWLTSDDPSSGTARLKLSDLNPPSRFPDAVVYEPRPDGRPRLVEVRPVCETEGYGVFLKGLGQTLALLRCLVGAQLNISRM